MPNHVTNIVTFVGKPERLKELREKCRYGDSEFSFQSFCPMPVELVGTTSPARIVSEEEMQKWKNDFESGALTDFEKDSRPLTQKESDFLLNNFGCNNWYDWHIQHWGTKWDCYSLVYDKNDDTTIQFNTAWSTPLLAMARLSEQFPDVEIHVKYADEDLGSNVGRYVLFAGIIEDDYSPSYGKDSIEMALEILGDKDYFTGDRFIDLGDSIEELDEFDIWLLEIAHEDGNLYEDYPVIVLNKLLEFAINDEQYERAEKIKNLIQSKVADVKK